MGPLVKKDCEKSHIMLALMLTKINNQNLSRLDF